MIRVFQNIAGKNMLRDDRRAKDGNNNDIFKRCCPPSKSKSAINDSYLLPREMPFSKVFGHQNIINFPKAKCRRVLCVRVCSVPPKQHVSLHRPNIRSRCRLTKPQSIRILHYSKTTDTLAPVTLSSSSGTLPFAEQQDPFADVLGYMIAVVT